MTEALCVLIILRAIRRRRINRNPARRLYWVSPLNMKTHKILDIPCTFDKIINRRSPKLYDLFKNGQGSIWSHIYIVNIRFVFAEIHFYPWWCDLISEWKTYTTHFEREHCSKLTTITYVFLSVVFHLLFVAYYRWTIYFVCRKRLYWLNLIG